MDSKEELELKEKWRKWITFRDFIVFEEDFKKNSHTESALRLMQEVLCKMYEGVPDMERLVTDADRHETKLAFSGALLQVAQEFEWAASTRDKTVSLCKKILRKTNIPKSFIETVKIARRIDKGNPILPAKYRPEGLPLLDQWILTIRRKTKSKSELSIKNVLGFFVTLCERDLGIDLKDWPCEGEGEGEGLVEPLKDAQKIKSICGSTKAALKKAKWLQMFITHMLGSDYRIPVEVLEDLELQREGREGEEEEDDGSDKHRIHFQDLDKLYEQVKKAGTLDELWFMLMITTGMRIGGVTRLKIQEIAKQTPKGTWKTLDQGRTREKGQKLFSFMLAPRVAELMNEWLNSQRPSDPSPYVFPGRHGERVHTGTIRDRFFKWCQGAGLPKGREFHPHALRHSYAHILLEAGNSTADVAKLLNHSRASTTEKWYLKESAAEVTARAIVPWLEGHKRKKPEPLPNFLAETRTTSKARERKKRRKARVENALSEFTGLSQALASPN